MGGFVNMKENWISLRVYEKANPELCWRKSVYFSCRESITKTRVFCAI